jgi:hypothetical protein
MEKFEHEQKLPCGASRNNHQIKMAIPGGHLPEKIQEKPEIRPEKTIPCGGTNPVHRTKQATQ